MSKPKRNFLSAVGKKAVSAVTGLLLTIFLIGHLAGNLLILRGHGESFNIYANTLNRIPVLIFIELLLVGLFGYHAYMGLRVYFENKNARPDGYAHSKWTGSERSRKSWASTTMHLSGAVVLLFLLLHIWHFKFGATPAPPDMNDKGSTYLVNHSPTDSNTDITNYERPSFKSTIFGGSESRDLAWLVVSEFKKPLIVVLYLASLLLLGLHLNHGFSSAFQSIGAGRLGKRLLLGGKVFTFLLIGGFMIIPLYVLFLWH